MTNLITLLLEERNTSEEKTEKTTGESEEDVDPLEEEVIKPGKKKLLEKLEADIDRIRDVAKPLAESLPIDDSQKAEVDRRIEQFRSATTIVIGGSAKKPKTRELSEELRTLLIPAAEIVVRVGVHLGRDEKARVVEVGRILDPIHRAIRDGKLGIWRGFCELCGVSHTQMYKYVNLYRAFGESLTEFHWLSLSELEVFKDKQNGRAATFVRDHLEELREAHGDLEAVKRIAGKSVQQKRKKRTPPYVKTADVADSHIELNVKTKDVRISNFSGDLEDVKRFVKTRTKREQKPNGDDKFTGNDDGSQDEPEEPYPIGWPSPGNTIVDDGTVDLSQSKRFATGFTESSFSIKGLWRNKNGVESSFSERKGAYEFPLTSGQARVLIRKEVEERPGTIEITVTDGTVFVMGHRVLRDGSSEIRWGIFN